VLRHIDLLVLATRYEELPSVLIEAMAAGLPVIASRVGGIPALVDHDVNSLLVPPGRRRRPRGSHFPRSGRAGYRCPAGRRRRPADRATVHLARAGTPGRRGLPAADWKTAAGLNPSRRDPGPRATLTSATRLLLSGLRVTLLPGSFRRGRAGAGQFPQPGQLGLQLPGFLLQL